MIKKLRYVVLGAKDVDVIVEHYTSSVSLAVAERAPGWAWLSTGDGVPSLGIEKGPSGLARIGLELCGSVDAAESQLTGAGFDVERIGATFPDRGEELVVRGPGDVPLHLHESATGSIETHSDGDLIPRRLGHVATFVNDLAAAEQFVRDGLQMRWGDSVALGERTFFSFWRCGPDHHTMNFMENADERGLHHLAFEARDIEHLKHVCDQFSRTGVTLDWGIGRHGPGHNVFSYHRDPEGNLVEVFTDLDVMTEEDSGAYEARSWHEDSPQKPKVWQFSPPVGNTWGPGLEDPEFLKAPAWIGEAIAAAQA
jgi:catechol 2,3-dioxygenase-like lactoylglutathione lyase family enzyme